MNEWEQCISEWADRNMKLQQQLADAQATVEALQQERDEAIEAASLPTWVCNGCGRVSSEGWINRVIDSFEGTDYEMECPTCGVRAIEEDCASDLVRERDDLQAALDAEREKVKGLHEITKVICTHCCEPMEIPSKAVLQTQLTQLQALVRRLKREIPTSRANVEEHARLQALHHEIDATLDATTPAREQVKHEK